VGPEQPEEQHLAHHDHRQRDQRDPDERGGDDELETDQVGAEVGRSQHRRGEQIAADPLRGR
jgi:hypothetical protein